jgi:YVTN family beta-propeller protein
MIGPHNIFSETTRSHIGPEVARDLAQLYVPNLCSNDVYVNDPSTLKIVDRFPVGRSPQDVVPSWDLRTLCVTSASAEARKSGRLLLPITEDEGYRLDAAAPAERKK